MFYKSLNYSVLIASLWISGISVAQVAEPLQMREFAENRLSRELQILKQRRSDFKKDRVYLSENEKLTRVEQADLNKLLLMRRRDQRMEEKSRRQFLQSQMPRKELDATQREAYEQRLQDKDDMRQIAIEKKYARSTQRENEIISNSHLLINEDEEYDLHIPKKENHAKARTPKAKK